jgi:hypothetical protein
MYAPGRRGLGQSPVASGGGNLIVGPAGTLINQAGAFLKIGGAILNEVESFFGFGSSDPARDAQRIARLNQAWSLASRNDPTPQPNLDNLSGRGYIEEIASDAPVPGGGTTSGSKVALTYARTLLDRLAGGGVITRPIPGLGVSPLVLGAVAVGAFFLLRRRR